MPDSTALPPARFRRAADLTAFRLGRAILAYLASITLIITLAPFRFAPAPVHGLTSLWDWSDLVMNIVMFVPIGFMYQLTRPVGAPVGWARVTLLAAALSGTIEVAQLFEATRYTSLFDLVTNTGGAVIGAWVCAAAIRRIEGPRSVRTLALELPLMGLVYLLIPLLWLAGLAGGDTRRDWLVLLIVAFGAGVIGTVYVAYIEPTRRLHRGWLLAAALVWYIVGMLPGGIRQSDVLLGGVAVALGVCWLASLSTSRRMERGEARRFEIPTLRTLLPLLAAHLALSSLWPLDGADMQWVGMWALLPDVESPTSLVFVALEHVAAFTVVGYIVAEFHGRDREHYREIAWPVIGWGTGLSVLLELVRGFHPAYRASVPMVLFTVGAAAFGGRLYQLQRDHVRALLTRRTSSAVGRDAATSSGRDVPGLSSL